MFSFLFGKKTHAEEEGDDEPVVTHERREHPRVEVPEYGGHTYMAAAVVGSKKRLRFRIIDLSEGGVRFRGITEDGRPGKGDLVDIELALGGHSLVARGETVWIENLSAGEEFVGGLKFEGLGAEAVKTIRSIVVELYRNRRSV